jgi:hypothetical protein
LGIGLAAAALALVGALAPEVEYDALWYHLGFPRAWLERGTLIDFPNEFVSLYPMTWELLYGVALSMGGPLAAKLLHFATMILTAGVVYRLARRWTPSASAWLAVALFVTVPTVLWEASTAYLDLGLTLFVALGVLAAWSYTQERSNRWLGLAVLGFGFAAATKHLALFVIGIVALGLVGVAWSRGYRIRRAIVPPLVVGAGALLVALPWYGRAWLATGNPFFPQLFSLFGASTERWDAVSQGGLDAFLSSFGRPLSLRNLVTLPWDMTVHSARYGGTLGPLFLLLIPPLAFLRRRVRAVPWIAGFVFLFILLWSSPLSSFQMRFLLPIVPFLAILGAEGFRRLGEATRRFTGPRGERLLAYTLAALLILNLAPFTSLHEVDRIEWQGWLTHVTFDIPVAVVVGFESEEQYLARKVPAFRAWQYINQATPQESLILTFTEGDHLYSERNRIWINATAARPAVWEAERGREASMFRSLGFLNVTYVLVDTGTATSPEMAGLALTDPGNLDRYFELEYQDARFAVYRIRWREVEASFQEVAGPA